jgi:hypothetical protein
MMWHEVSESDQTLVAIETVAHWVGADINTIARALATLEPRRLPLRASELVLDKRTAKRSPGEPVDLAMWDVVVTANLPLVLRHKHGAIEVWRCSIDWRGVSQMILQMVDEPITIDTVEGDEVQQTKRLLKAIAIQRTKQARRSTICTWCGTSMVKGERFSTYCCYGCASTMKGVVY